MSTFHKILLWLFVSSFAFVVLSGKAKAQRAKLDAALITPAVFVKDETLYKTKILSVSKIEYSKGNIVTPRSPQSPDRSDVVAPRSDIEAYINQVFGEFAPRAFLLLMGKGPKTCHENLGLDPRAVNDNTMWGGKGQDIGIFQINTYWHPEYTRDQLFDWKTNVDIAHQIFISRHNSFDRWSCGKYYEI